MTLTHRATPSCLPERRHATSFEAALSSQAQIDSMAELAKAECQAAGLGHPKQAKRGPLGEAEVIAAIAAYPGIANVPLSEYLGRNRATLTAKLKTLADQGKIRVEKKRKGGRIYARYWLA